MHTTDHNVLSDEAILAALGERLARHRLDRNRTQSDVAFEAGVSRRSIYKLEHGQPVDTRILVRVLRSLDLLPGLDALVPEPEVSPVALLEARGKERARASGSRRTAPVPTSDKPGTWQWPNDRS